MNLPQSATDFLDVFIGYSRRNNEAMGFQPGGTHPLPTIHVYAFSSAEDPVNDVAQRAAARLGCSIEALGSAVVTTASLGIVGICGPRELNLIAEAIYTRGNVVGHLVRDVAPKKMMVCLSFVLPECVANAEQVIVAATSTDDLYGEKKPRSDDSADDIACVNKKSKV